MDLEKTGKEIGAEVEGIRNRLSFLEHNPTPGYVSLEQKKLDDDALQSPGIVDDAETTPFDALFLTVYFIQIYVIQLIVQIIIIIWTFMDASDVEHDVLLALDCFAVALLCVEVSSGFIAKGGEFVSDWGGRIDCFVAVLSVLALATYFVGVATEKIDADHVSTHLELLHAGKFLRDIMRVVRLPVFVRNVLAVWRYYEASCSWHKLHKPRSR